MSPVYGIMSDDFTGGLLVASYFEEAGLECPVYFDSATAAADRTDAPIVVVAGRTRLMPVEDAKIEIARTLDAFDALGCATVAYKACASFDSTEEGNVGSASEALADRYGDTPILISAGFPEFRCTVHHGHLFYRGMLVNESVKRFDPVTPMPDPNLVRFLSKQTTTPLGLVTHLDMVEGEAAARAALGRQIAAGHRHVLLDCSDQGDVTMSTTLALGRRAIVASDPLIVSLGLALGAGREGSAAPPRHAKGPAAVLAGSVGPVAEEQLAAFGTQYPLLTISLLHDAAEEAQIQDALAWAKTCIGTPFAVTTCADEALVRAAQARLGRLGAARKAERILAGVGEGLHRLGIRRFIVAGGETSGAVVTALRVTRVRPFARGAIGGGFCVTEGPDPTSFFLKSGKLGARDVLLRALDEMQKTSP